MTESSSNSIVKSTVFNRYRLLFAVLACVISVITLIGSIELSKEDPFISSTMKLSGSSDNGGKIFKINCVGCHGISAQGLLGPDLHSVKQRLSQKKIINQIVKGRTPPMPSFEIEPQSMADLLAYLHTLE